MRTVFVDTLYWIALINPKDQWHDTAIDMKKALGNVRLVTSEPVLVEVLNYFSSYGLETRQTAADVVHDILDDPFVGVVPHTSETFMSGLALYEARPDKGYSLTDCMSMQIMRERGLVEALTHDKHFSQEGFTNLL